MLGATMRGNRESPVPLIQAQGTVRTITCGEPQCATSFPTDQARFDHWKTKHGKVPT
jgi:hypothetical protein